MDKGIKFSILISPELVRDLDVIKEIDDKSRASVIRNALLSYVAQRKRAIATYRRKLSQSEAA